MPSDVLVYFVYLLGSPGQVNGGGQDGGARRLVAPLARSSADHVSPSSPDVSGIPGRAGDASGHVIGFDLGVQVPRGEAKRMELPLRNELFSWQRTAACGLRVPPESGQGMRTVTGVGNHASC